MNANCKGTLACLNKSYRTFIHNGKQMSKAEVKAVLEYAIDKGYEHTGLLSNEEIDMIIKKISHIHT